MLEFPSLAPRAPRSCPSLRCGRFTLDFERPLVMGILNVTPDSFSDGGRYLARDAALRRAEQMLAEGADLLDVGGESTRPGAPPLALAEELDRVLPLVAALRDVNVPLSVDTYKPAVMRAALDAGAALINDIWAFRQPGALEVVRGSDCGLCVMHMRADPRTMQAAPVYDDVISEVKAFLDKRVAGLVNLGIDRARICVDPGFGFGKTVAHNYALLAALSELAPRDAQGTPLPVLAGLSRKSMLGAVTGRAAQARVAASIAAAVCAFERGAAIVRVHDVAETMDALKIWCALRTA